MSQSSNKGRRTPLTLGNNKTNGRKNNGGNHEATAVLSEKSAPNETVSVDLLKQKATVEVTKDTTVHQSNGKSAKNGNGTAAATEKNAASSVPSSQKDGSKKEEVKKSDKKDDSVKASKKDRDEVSSKKEESKKKDESVKASKKEEVSSKKQDDPKAETPKKDEKPVVSAENEKPNGAKSTVASSPKSSDKPEMVRESPRQKEARETREKEEQSRLKLEEQREIDEAMAAFKAQEEAESKAAAVALPTPTTPDAPEPDVQLDIEPSTAPMSISLLEQSDMNGFDVDDEEMEALRMENDGFDSPMPKSAKTKSKTFKFTDSPAANRIHVSPFRRSIETNASTAVNLSTVSELSTEASSSPAIPVGASNVPGEQCYGSLRHITGRKSTRPLRELTLQHTMRESYRRIKTELDDSFSSMNATVGSEIHNDSFRTPIVAVKGRKRTAIGGSEPDLTSVVESPKKARLDLSGFFTVMASPVTLLRNKFSRASLLSSTPNGKKLNVDAVEPLDDKVEPQPEVDVLNVSGIEDVQMVDVDLGKCDQTDVDAEVASVTAKLDDGPDVIPVAADEIVIETEQLKSVDDIKDKITQEEARQDEDKVIITEHKKGRCAIM